MGRYTQQEEREYYEKTKKVLKLELDKHDVELLRALIRYHEWKYYVQNSPVISDFEFDQLFNKLKTLEQKHPELIRDDSPTQRVSSDISADFKTVEHLSPMLSLANSYDASELLKFDEQVKKLCQIKPDTPVEYIVEPKFDGGSVALLYRDNRFVRAATRGDGTGGDDITANIKTLPSVPLFADFAKYGIHVAELRGEALINKTSFERLNNHRAEMGLPLFANARNAATGGLRMKNPAETAERGLELFTYQLGVAQDVRGQDVLDTFGTHQGLIDILTNLGFKVPLKQMTLCRGIEEVIAFCKTWEEKRENYNYEIDGMVVKLNRLDYQKQCGATSHHPRWAVAYKFKAKQATTKLLQVKYQVGKIGSITPVAKVEPVRLSGVTISSISLHNEEFVRSKDLRIGDTILIERSGDVIPYIVKSFAELRTGKERKIEFPRHCPDCKTALVQDPGEAAWRCPNYQCKSQNIQRLIFHISKNAMDIDGMGASTIERFYELGWIKDFSDIYNLDYQKIAGLDGFGELSATKLRAGIEEAKRRPLYRLLHSLSIHHLGRRSSKLIAAETPYIFELASMDPQQLESIKNIGPVLAQNIARWFGDEENIAVLRRMEAYGVNMYRTPEDLPEKVADDAPLKGKTILFTGKLTQMSRNEAKALAEKAGAKNISAVSSNLDMLVVGEKAGSKLQKAQSMGNIKILTEEEFIALTK